MADALIPADALDEFRALALVLRQSGPVPCEFDAELWWSAAQEDANAAVGACGRCPALAECAAYAKAAGEREGIWGGLAPAERGQVRRW